MLKWKASSTFIIQYLIFNISVLPVVRYTDGMLNI